MASTTTSAATPPDAPPAAHRHLGLALAVISAAQLMVVLDGTIVNIALPHIQTALSFTPENLSWVVNAYTLAFGGLLLLGGRAGDLLGRRKVFVVGVGVFALASLLGGLAQTEGQLLWARVLQGLGAAIASPTALSLVTTTFPAGPARNRAFAVYAAMSGAGAAIGLLLGGVLTEVSWRWTFLVNVPIGILVIAAAPRVLAESAREKGSFDVPGAVTATVGLVSLVYGLTHAATTAWRDGTTVTTIALGVVLLAVFLVIESRSRHALMPSRILADRTRAVSYLVMLIVGAGMFAMFYFLGLYIQQVLGYSAVKAGFSFLPFSVGIVVGAAVASNLSSKVNPRWVAGIGTAIAGVALLMFSRLDITDSPSAILQAAANGGHLGSSVNYWTDLFPWIVLMATGMGLTFVPMTLAAVHRVDHRDSGVGSGVLNTMQQVGGALGLATLSTVAVSTMNDKVASLMGSLGSAGNDPGVAAVVQAQAAFTSGSTDAFLTGAFMIWAASLIVWIFLDVKHEEMATDDLPEGIVVA